MRTTLTLSRILFACLILAALVAGLVIGFLLPRGTATLSTVDGHAQLDSDGVSGTFQPDVGPTALLPTGVRWVDADGQHNDGSRPECLWADGENIGARVQAAYTWVRTPDGARYPLVAWLRCP